SPGQVKCPGCGHERKRRALVDQVPGELIEIDGKKLNRTMSWDDKRKFIAGLKRYAIEHGYQPGWVAHKYHERFGVWPNDPRVKHEPPAEYGVELQRWLKSQQIRWAKRRKAA